MIDLKNLRKIFESLAFDSPVFINNLILYPIKTREVPPCEIYENLIDLDTAFEKGWVKMDEIEVVPEIKIKNNGKKPLLILDGEILVGGKQDRVVITSSIIEPETSHHIPVACVEEGRWGGTSNKFTRSSISHSKLRGITSKSIRLSQVEDRVSADQKAIWAETSRKLQTLNISSPTKTLTALSHEKLKEINDYLDYSPKSDEEVGLFAIASGKFLGVDIFATPDLYKRYSKKIVLGYSWDAIEYKTIQPEKQSNEILQAYLSFLRILPQNVELHEIKTENNLEIRFTYEACEGKILLYNENFIHACLMNPK